MILRALKYLLLPPALNILLLVFAYFALRPWPKLRVLTVTGSILSLWLMSTPFVAVNLAELLQNQYPALTLNKISDLGQNQHFDAIVILGAGRNYRADEWQLEGAEPNHQHSVNEYGLQRLYYGAALAKASGKPMLLTGGKVFKEPLSEADLMQNTLTTWGTEAKWLEHESRTTAENAVYSFRMLEAEGIQRIALVTHAWHMPRSVAVFEKAGFQVVPAPTIFYAMPNSLVLRWLPKAHYLEMSSLMLHELLGQLWYQFKASGGSD